LQNYITVTSLHCLQNYITVTSLHCLQNPARCHRNTDWETSARAGGFVVVKDVRDDGPASTSLSTGQRILSFDDVTIASIAQAETRLKQQGDLFVFAAAAHVSSSSGSSAATSAKSSTPAASTSAETARAELREKVETSEIVLRRDGMTSSYGFRCTSRAHAEERPPR
jgi:hypothetical protein